MLKNLMTLLLVCGTLAIFSCGNSDAPEGMDEGTKTEVNAHDHSGHDHDGHDHAGHDHDGHDHSGHDHSGHDHGTAAAHGPTAAHNAAYVCPMHCEGSGSEEMGKCPVCGMDYVAMSDHTKNGHTHK